MADYRERFDQEDRFNELVGLLTCVEELLSGQEHGGMVRAEPLTYYVRMLVRYVHEAVPNGAPKHGRPVNDLDSG